MRSWENGDNHLLFNMVSGSRPHYNTSLDVRTDRALIAGAGFDTWTYRHGYDLSIPFYKPGLSDARIEAATDGDAQRPYLLIAAQLNLFARHNRILHELAFDNQRDVLVLQTCDVVGDSTKMGTQGGDRGRASMNEAGDAVVGDWRCSFPAQERHSYPDVLADGRFCLVARSMRLVPLNLMESMAAGCVPVFMADNLVLPFDEVNVEVGYVHLFNVTTDQTNTKTLCRSSTGRWPRSPFAKRICTRWSPACRPSVPNAWPNCAPKCSGCTHAISAVWNGSWTRCSIS